MGDVRREVSRVSEAGRLVDRDGVAAPLTYSTAAGQHGGLVRGVADALQFQRATAAAEDRGAVPKWLVTILLFFELSLLAGERTCGRGKGGRGLRCLEPFRRCFSASGSKEAKTGGDGALGVELWWKLCVMDRASTSAHADERLLLARGQKSDEK